MCLVKDVEAYIGYLKKQHGLYVSLHPAAGEKFISTSSLIACNLHANPYCLYLKANEPLWQKCIRKQEKVLGKCVDGSFFGMCHAGVEEFVYPIRCGEKTVGFVSVSGYRKNPEKAAGYLNETARTFSLDRDGMEQMYNRYLSDEVPDPASVDALLQPLCHMLELGNLRLEHVELENGNEEQASFYRRVLHEVNLNHTRTLTVRMLCARFHCSASYISHQFKKYNGKSISDYVNDLRIEEAKSLLEGSGLSVQSIAATVGFSDGNYFSNVFRKRCGCSPRAYRKAVWVGFDEKQEVHRKQ